MHAASQAPGNSLPQEASGPHCFWLSACDGHPRLAVPDPSAQHLPAGLVNIPVVLWHDAQAWRTKHSRLLTGKRRRQLCACHSSCGDGDHRRHDRLVAPSIQNLDRAAVRCDELTLFAHGQLNGVQLGHARQEANVQNGLYLGCQACSIAHGLRGFVSRRRPYSCKLLEELSGSRHFLAGRVLHRTCTAFVTFCIMVPIHAVRSRSVTCLARRQSALKARSLARH